MTRILTCLIAALLSVGLAFADAMDPRMNPVEPDAGGSGGGTPIIVGASLHASFTLHTSGTPALDACTTDSGDWFCSLINQSGQDWSSFTVDVSPGSGDLSNTFCGTYLGFTCSVSQAGPSDPTEFLFTGGLLPDQKAFQLNFIGWAADSRITLDANQVPEPSAIVLLVTMLGGIGVTYRRRTRA